MVRKDDIGTQVDEVTQRHKLQPCVANLSFEVGINEKNDRVSAFAQGDADGDERVDVLRRSHSSDQYLHGLSLPGQPPSGLVA